MKKFATIAALIAAMLIAPAFAQKTGVDDMKGMDSMKGMEKPDKMDKPNPMSSHHGVGVVKKVDSSTQIVTLAHDPVKSLGWPAMTMGFKVKDKKLMDRLNVDKKVEFDFVQDGNAYVVTAVK